MSWSPTDFPELRPEALFGDRVVPCFRDRPRHFHQLLADAAARFPGREALAMGQTRFSWAALAAECDRVAAALAADGAGPGERVAILMQNAPEFVVALFAVARLGAIAVPCSVRASAPEIAYILEDSGARLLVHDGRQAERLPEAAAVRFRAYADLSGAGPLPDAFPDEQDTAFILYTSGTTGRPKGAMLAHVNIVHSALFYEAAMRVTHTDRVIAAVPLNHVTGVAALIATSVRAGACLIVMEAFKTRPFLDLAEAEGMTYTLMVPAMYNLCLLQPDFPSAGSAPGGSPPTAARRCRSRRSASSPRRSRAWSRQLLRLDRDHRRPADHAARLRLREARVVGAPLPARRPSSWTPTAASCRPARPASSGSRAPTWSKATGATPRPRPRASRAASGSPATSA